MFLCLGIIGEYLIVMFQELKHRPTAIVDYLIGDMNMSRPASQINTLGAIVSGSSNTKRASAR